MEVGKGDKVEVSSDEEGFRGAWFRGEVIKKHGAEGFVVEYKDLMSDKDETKPLREKVDIKHVRPCPPEQERDQFSLYEEVDAFDNDGWWVGVVTRVLEYHKYLVYFMQTREEIPFHHSQLRPHLDFIDMKWVQASKELIKSSSPGKDADLENGNDTLMSRIFSQNTETMELPNPSLAVEKKAETNASTSSRRSSRSAEKPKSLSPGKGSLGGGNQIDGLPVAVKRLTRISTRRKQRTQGNIDNISHTNTKMATEEIVDLETPDASPQQGGKQESHQFSASQESHQFSASPTPLDKGIDEKPTPLDRGVDETTLNTHLAEIHDTSLLEAKAERPLGSRKTQRKSGSHSNNVLACKRKRDNTQGTGANGMEKLEVLIGVKEKKKNSLKSSSSPYLSEAPNAIMSETHKEVNPNSNAINVGSHNISACSLGKKEPNKNNMAHETNASKEIGVEKANLAIPSGSPDRSEKIFTITIPHVEYVGHSSAVQGNSGSLLGRASFGELKLLAYHSVLQALYLQGAHNWKHEVLLTNLRESLNISNEEHSVELRRITTASYD